MKEQAKLKLASSNFSQDVVGMLSKEHRVECVSLWKDCPMQNHTGSPVLRLRGSSQELPYTISRGRDALQE